MMDFEVLKLKDEKWAMQVRGKFYDVPRKYRTLNRMKLMHVFDREDGTFQPLVAAKVKGL